jgi:peptidoglycan/LPS O-acetylase OafA/YrhL
VSSSVPIARRASAGPDPLATGLGDRPIGDTGPRTATRFRPDVEGLRAVAVLLVLAYHARLLGITGGYIGVDVFFVVSGFLITGLITRELERTGTVSLPAFYARRARRLLPAALLVIVVTIVASAVILPPLRTTEVAADGAASALYVGNLRFALQATDYLQADLAPSPLLHYWSLGVEEQFYLFWPALLLLVAGRRIALNRVAVAVAVVGIASFALSIVWTETDAPLAFFLLPTRAWELAVGAALALAAARVATVPAWVSTAAVAAGLALIVAGAMLFDLETPFPGTAALVPVAGGALVLAGGLRQPLGSLSRLLALGPMRYIGRISYSLYLWHWPVLVLPAVLFGGPLPAVIRLGLALLTIPLAAASQRWVEDPIRHGRFVPVRIGRALALAGTLSAVVAIISMGIGGANPLAAAATSGQAVDAPSVDLVLPTPVAAPSGGSPSGRASSGATPSAGAASPTPGLLYTTPSPRDS